MSRGCILWQPLLFIRVKTFSAKYRLYLKPVKVKVASRKETELHLYISPDIGKSV